MSKLEINTEGVTQETSGNGKILQETLDETNCIAASLNASQGHWTRQNRKNITERSIIDYIIVEKEKANLINELIIDEPGWYRLKNEGTGGKETDYNTILLEIHNPCIWKAEKKTSMEKRNSRKMGKIQRTDGTVQPL